MVEVTEDWYNNTVKFYRENLDFARDLLNCEHAAQNERDFPDEYKAAREALKESK